MRLRICQADQPYSFLGRAQRSGNTVRSRMRWFSFFVVASVVLQFAKNAEGQTNTQRVRIETELITIYPHGFEPARIERVAGPCFLAIDNKSGIKDLTLRLDRVGGGRIKEAKAKKDKYRLREIVDLTPGRYILTEEARRTWRCEIVVTSQ